MMKRLLCVLAYHQWQTLFRSGSVTVIGCKRCSKMAMRDYSNDDVELWG